MNWKTLLWGCILFFVFQIVIIVRIAYISENPDRQVKNTRFILNKNTTHSSTEEDTLYSLSAKSEKDLLKILRANTPYSVHRLADF